MFRDSTLHPPEELSDQGCWPAGVGVWRQGAVAATELHRIQSQIDVPSAPSELLGELG